VVVGGAPGVSPLAEAGGCAEQAGRKASTDARITGTRRAFQYSKLWPHSIVFIIMENRQGRQYRHA
jgi:hypothetical protein